MLRNYAVIAVKVLLRRKFFTAVNLFGIAFTLTVLLVATALLTSVFGSEAPNVHGDRLLGLYTVRLEGDSGQTIGPAGWALLDPVLRDLPGAAEVSVISVGSQAASYLDGGRVDSWLRRTDGAFWRVFHFDFLEGGPFTDADTDAGRMVAVINAATRDRFFAGSDAVGREIELDGQRFRVVGVVADVSPLQLAAFSDAWVPITTAKSSAYRHEIRGALIGLILPESRRAIRAVKAEVRHRIETFQLPDPDQFDTIYAGADTLAETVARTILDSRRREAPVTLLRAIVVLVALLFMALPAINLTNLNVSRILERAPEIGVRKAYGASSATLVGQFVVENLILTALGAILGLAGAAVVLQVLEGSGLIPYAHLGINAAVLGWGVVLTFVFGLLSGVFPAWKMSRLHPAAALHGRTL